MKYGVYYSIESDKLVILQKHETREDRVYLIYKWRDEVLSDPVLLTYFKTFMKGRYLYIGNI